MSETETKYLPSNWLDEVIPSPQFHPNNFVFHSEKIGWHMRDPDEDGDPEEGDGWLTLLTPEQVVGFSANRVFGDFTLTVEPDGSFSTNRPIPQEANCFRIDYDIDTLADSLATMVKNGTGFDGRLEAGTYDIDAYWWSNEEYLFKFHVIDGRGVFVPNGVRQ